MPRSASLASVEPARRPVNAAAPDVDRYTGDADGGSGSERPDQVVAELRSLAALHQAQQAARSADRPEAQAA